MLKVAGHTGPNRALAVADHARMVVVPILLVVFVAIGVIVVVVLWAGRNGTLIALDHERQLIHNALVDKRAQVVREIVSMATAEGTAHNILANFDVQWVDSRVGRRLTKVFGHDFIFIVDVRNAITYAFTGQGRADPSQFDDMREVIVQVVADLRDKASDQAEASGPAQSVARGHFVSFLGQPAIIGAALIKPVNAHPDVASADPPVLIGVEVLDAAFLRETSIKLGLDNLRLASAPTAPGGDQAMDILDSASNRVALIAWTPRRLTPATDNYAWPFVATALVGFLLLGGFILRYMRSTSARISAGESQLRHLALHDPLSSLPNRAFFSERLLREIEEGPADGTQSAVLSIDLDDFKGVNDTLGHHVGDALIGVVAQRLLHNLRHDDFVARLGGDEFAIITGGFNRPEEALQVAERVIAVLCAPYSIMGHSMIVGASIGIAMIDGTVEDATGIMRRADVALYRAKSDGKNHATVYDAHMDADLHRRKQLEMDLAEAIAADGLHLEYQPVVRSDGERIIAVEALARWHHASRGDVPPSEFIPVAEQSGLIVPLGEWVLRQSCLAAKAWPDITLAVNVSPLQFKRVDFVDVVKRILDETGFEPRRLELELTESILLGNVEQAGKVMKRLKELGVRLALDDFGTGYSSLLYLRTFPFDKLKIDRSFVQSIKPASEAAAIVHAIVSLGRGLRMSVTAEGVETAEQHLFLRAAGVHSMQGFLFGKPQFAGDITGRLMRQIGASVKRAG